MNNQRRLEILGLLLISISLFLFISFAGYNPNEEPSISPNITIENPIIVASIDEPPYDKIGKGDPTIGNKPRTMLIFITI